MECKLILNSKSFRTGREIGRKLLVARFRDGHILGEKLHFLSHAAANDDVVAVETCRSALAVEYLIPNVVVDEALQFLLIR